NLALTLLVSGLFIYALFVGLDAVRPLLPVFVVFGLALARCLSAAQKISGNSLELADKSASMVRIAEFLGEHDEAPGEAPTSASSVPIPAGIGDLALNSIGFSYG